MVRTSVKSFVTILVVPINRGHLWKPAREHGRIAQVAC